MESMVLLADCWCHFKEYGLWYNFLNNTPALVFGSTLTLSKFSGQVEDARRPSLFSFLQISSPSVSRSTMKQVMPLYPCQSQVTLSLGIFFKTLLFSALHILIIYNSLFIIQSLIQINKQYADFWFDYQQQKRKRKSLTADGSTLAITRKTPACSALLIHILDPLIM